MILAIILDEEVMVHKKSHETMCKGCENKGDRPLGHTGSVNDRLPAPGGCPARRTASEWGQSTQPHDGMTRSVE